MANFIVEAMEMGDIDNLERIIQLHKFSIDDTAHVENLLLTTPLALAIHMESLELVQLLLKYNADPTVECDTGTPLSIAVLSPNRIDIVRLLLSLPAIDINQQDRSGQTALLHACAFKNKLAVQLLTFQATLNVHTANHIGNTAIFYCMNDVDLFSMLYIDKDANVNVMNAEGVTPLQILFEDVTNEVYKYQVVQPIVKIIFQADREDIELSADTLANIITCEHILPQMFINVVSRSVAAELESELAQYGTNCILLSIHLGLIHVVRYIMSVTDYDLANDPAVALALMNEDSPVKSYNMLLYLQPRYNIDFGVIDQERNTVLAIAIATRCMDIAYWIADNVRVNYSLEELQQLATVVLQAEDLVLLQKTINLLNFIPAIVPYLNNTTIEDINARFVDKGLRFIVQHQGYLPVLQSAPLWFKQTDTYAAIQKYNTLKYMSYATLPDRNSSTVVKHFKDHGML